MGDDSVSTLLVSMLQRKIVRLQDLQSRYAESGRFGHHANEGFAELQELSIDICDLARALWIIILAEATGDLASNATYDSSVVETFTSEVCGDAFDIGSLHSIVRDPVWQRTAMEVDPSSALEERLRNLERVVSGLQEFADATAPTGIAAIVLRVGLLTVSACSGALTGVLLFHEAPLVKRVLGSAVETFIGAAVVEAGNALIKRSQLPARDKSVKDSTADARFEVSNKSQSQNSVTATAIKAYSDGGESTRAEPLRFDEFPPLDTDVVGGKDIHSPRGAASYGTADVENQERATFDPASGREESDDKDAGEGRD